MEMPSQRLFHFSCLTRSQDTVIHKNAGELFPQCSVNQDRRDG
jgi:hypothetical protein